VETLGASAGGIRFVDPLQHSWRQACQKPPLARFPHRERAFFGVEAAGQPCACFCRAIALEQVFGKDRVYFPLEVDRPAPNEVEANNSTGRRRIRAMSAMPPLILIKGEPQTLLKTAGLASALPVTMRGDGSGDDCACGIASLRRTGMKRFANRHGRMGAMIFAGNRGNAAAQTKIRCRHSRRMPKIPAAVPQTVRESTEAITRRSSAS